MKTLDEINGALSLVCVSDNFLKDYCKMHLANLTLHPKIIPGVLLSSLEHKEKSYLSSKVSMSSFISLKNILDKNSQDLSIIHDDYPIHKIYNTVFSFFENEPIIGFCDQYLKDLKLLHSNLVFFKNNEILCTEIGLGDMLCLSLITNLPIYIRKEVIDKNGDEYEKAISRS